MHDTQRAETLLFAVAFIAKPEKTAANSSTLRSWIRFAVFQRDYDDDSDKGFHEARSGTC